MERFDAARQKLVCKCTTITNVWVSTNLYDIDTGNEISHTNILT